MRRSLLSVAAMLAAFSMPLIAVAPASASAPDLDTFNFDCDLYDFQPFAQTLPLYAPSVTVTFSNCNTEFDLATPVTGNVSTSAGQVDDTGNYDLATITVSGPANVFILNEVDGLFAELEFIEPYEMSNPSGIQLADTSQEMPANAPSTTYGTPEQIRRGSEIEIGGIDECDIDAGEHIYATQSFTVDTAGEFTFRVIGVDPLNEDFVPNDAFGIPGSQLDDPFVALYSTFNTLNTGANVVGCNDDLNDLVVDGHNYYDTHYNVTQQGDFVTGRFSYFSTDLEPGDYMLVFSTFSDISTEEWADETPEGGTVYFDIWGPSASLTLTDVEPIAVAEPIAPTGGVNPSFALWSGLALAGVGVSMAIARRRELRK